MWTIRSRFAVRVQSSKSCALRKAASSLYGFFTNHSLDAATVGLMMPGPARIPRTVDSASIAYAFPVTTVSALHPRRTSYCNWGRVGVIASSASRRATYRPRDSLTPWFLRTPAPRRIPSLNTRTRES